MKKHKGIGKVLIGFMRGEFSKPNYISYRQGHIAKRAAGLPFCIYRSRCLAVGSMRRTLIRSYKVV